MPAVKITNKPVSTPGDQTHFLVTQPELPEGYAPTGQETEEELAELKVESLREIEMDDMAALIQEKLDMDATPTTGSSKPVTSGGIKAALDLMDEDISSLNEEITNSLDSVDAKIGELKENLDENVSELKNDTDDLKSHINEISGQSYNLLNAFLSPATINSSGNIETATGSASGYAVAYAEVQAGKDYSVITTDSIMVYAFFTNVPQIGSTGYDGRHIDNNGRTFTSPVDGYVAIRTNGTSGEVQINEGTNVLPYANPATAIDSVARLSVDTTKTEIEDIFYDYLFKGKRELFDKNAVLDGYFVKASDGTLAELNTFFTTDYIQVRPTMHIGVSGGTGGAQVAFYTIDKTFISGMQTNANSFDVPNTDTIAYMRWCSLIANENTASLIGSISDTYIIKNGDSLLHGVISAYNGGFKKIIVQAGTYDLIADYKNEYGNEYFSSYSGAYNGHAHGNYDAGVWLDDIEITFMAGSKVSCIYDDETQNTDVREYFSAFAVGSNAVIDGLYLEAENLRYGIHPDFHPNTDNEKIVFKNCDLKHRKSGTHLHNNQSIGAGLGVHSSWLVENCIFHSDTDHPVLRIHNNVSSDAESRITIRNCYVEGNGYILLNSYSTSQHQTVATVSGCSWVTPATVGKETEESNDNITMIAWNNETRT